MSASLDALAGMDAAALERRWRQLFGAAPPPGLPPAQRARVIAYRLQSIAYGDLDRDTARALDRLVRARDQAGQGGDDTPIRILVPVPDRRGHIPGVTLSREWAGVMHNVQVLDAGYAWNGSTYDSLSRVAQLITGTKWNGPRFFGLRAKTTGGREAGAGRIEA
ncbi:DUF2924 domain-containing protein [Methylobacterium sp. J-076]|uniref:DUF2924 domain-containing protein n=1 Tax=Methylobacterium sp. J-076 TaxID=2836655 RepID=UPI001FBBE9F0|nr:DUF2924 domain-containing protein [Methylobacterium sp. J-076]MCJ2011858.1 DUF2924 domain-containing protein [Methylobacterium sp. J-076]